MKFVFISILGVILLASSRQPISIDCKLQSIDYNHFIQFTDSFLHENYAKEYLSLAKNPASESVDFSFASWDSLAILDPAFVGSFHISPFPVYAELYRQNLQGDAKKEFVLVLYISPMVDWVNYIFIFDSNEESPAMLDAYPIYTKEGISKIEFQKLRSEKYFDLIVNWDQSISVYVDKGITMLTMRHDSIFGLLEVATLGLDWMDYSGEKQLEEDYENRIMREVIFGKRDSNRSMEIIVNEKEDIVIANWEIEPETQRVVKVLSRKTKKYNFDPLSGRYKLNEK